MAKQALARLSLIVYLIVLASSDEPKSKYSRRRIYDIIQSHEARRYGDHGGHEYEEGELPKSASLKQYGYLPAPKAPVYYETAVKHTYQPKEKVYKENVAGYAVAKSAPQHQVIASPVSHAHYVVLDPKSQQQYIVYDDQKHYHPEQAVYNPKHHAVYESKKPVVYAKQHEHYNPQTVAYEYKPAYDSKAAYYDPKAVSYDHKTLIYEPKVTEYDPKPISYDTKARIYDPKPSVYDSKPQSGHTYILEEEEPHYVIPEQKVKPVITYVPEYHTPIKGTGHYDKHHHVLDKGHQSSGHGHYGDNSVHKESGHKSHKHHDASGHKSHSSSGGHHDEYDKHHKKVHYERDRGYHYEKAYAYDHVRSNHDIGGSKGSHSHHHADHASQGHKDSGDHGGHSYVYYKKNDHHGGQDHHHHGVTGQGYEYLPYKHAYGK